MHVLVKKWGSLAGSVNFVCKLTRRKVIAWSETVAYIAGIVYMLPGSRGLPHTKDGCARRKC